MFRCCITFYQTDFYCFYSFLHTLCLDAKVRITASLISSVHFEVIESSDVIVVKSNRFI